MLVGVWYKQKESDPNPYTLSRTLTGISSGKCTISKNKRYHTHGEDCCQTRKYFNNFNVIITCTRSKRFTLFLILPVSFGGLKFL